MLGSPCSPCCDICLANTPRDELYTYVVVPAQLSDWSGFGPLRIGDFILTRTQFTGAKYTFSYRATIFTSDIFFDVDLYPFDLISGFSPQKNIDGGLYLAYPEACGLVDFYYQETRYDPNFLYFAMQPQGNLQYTSQHQNPNLQPVWANGPNKGSDGVDRTQYGAWTYGSVAPGGKRGILQFGPLLAQYQQTLYGQTFAGSSFEIRQ